MFSVANVCVLGCLPPVAGLEGNKITPALRWLAPAMRFLERLTVDRGQHGYEVGWGDGERSSLGGKVGVAIGAPCKSNDRCMEGEARNITKGLKVGRGGQGAGGRARV